MKINSWEYRLKGQATIEYFQYSVMNTTQDGEKDIVNLFYELTQIYRIFEFVFLYAFILSDHLKKTKNNDTQDEQ